MPVWIVYLLLAVLAVAVIALPLLKWKGASAGAAADPADPAAPGAPKPPGLPFGLTRGRLLTLGGVVAVLAAAVALYLATGDKPPPPPLATLPGAGPTAGAGLPDVDTMIERLAKRLEASPNDPEGWRMLGWSYFETQRYAESVKAYARAVALAAGDAGFQSAYGEAQVKAAGDSITPAAEKAFRASLAADPKDERARLYMARLKAAKGDGKGAIADLFAILETAAADSRMAPAVRAAIRKVAADNGIDISGRLPPEPAAPAGPTADDVAAARQMPADDQQAMIGGMVGRLEARLAASPRDVDGWIMLMRSRKTLGQDDQARAARDKAMAVFGDDAAARARLSAAALELGVS